MTTRRGDLVRDFLRGGGGVFRALRDKEGKEAVYDRICQAEIDRTR